MEDLECGLVQRVNGASHTVHSNEEQTLIEPTLCFTDIFKSVVNVIYSYMQTCSSGR